MFKKFSDKTFRGFIAQIMLMQRCISSDIVGISELDTEIVRIKHRIFKIATCSEIKGDRSYTLNILRTSNIEKYEKIANYFKDSGFVVSLEKIEDETDERVGVLVILI